MRSQQHLDFGCPWHRLSELRLPNVDWCEAPRCAWVVEPANTWSNVAYVLVGLAMLWFARSSSDTQLRCFGPAAIVVGVCSGVYHASNSFALQILDFFGMYVFCYLLICANLLRAGSLDPGRWWSRYGLLVFGTTVGTVAVDLMGLPIQGIVFGLVLVIVGTEAWARRTDPRGSLRLFLVAVCSLGVGGVFSVLDATRRWCDPDSLLQGHALWHVFAAVCLLASFLYYCQLATTPRS